MDSINLVHYAHRLVRFLQISPACILGACWLLKRARDALPKHAFGVASTHRRLILASLRITDKLLRDQAPASSTLWAQAASVAAQAGTTLPYRDVNLGERQILDLLHYEVHLNKGDLMNELQLALSSVPKEMATAIPHPPLDNAHPSHHEPVRVLPVHVSPKGPKVAGQSIPSPPLLGNEVPMPKVLACSSISAWNPFHSNGIVLGHGGNALSHQMMSMKLKIA
jgi:hypothetical protein